MSQTAEDRLQGRRLTVVYGVTPLSLATSGGRWERSREIRRHLSRTRGANAVLVTRTPDGGEESWWAARGAGVSFAAAIDQWLHARIARTDASPLPGRLHVVVPLDDLIYFATVETGIITAEAVLAPEPARRRLAEIARDGVVYGFNGGRCTGPVAEHVELEDPDPPCDLTGFRYGRPGAVLLRHGLFHPVHAALAVLAVALAVAAGSGLPRLAAGLPWVGDWLRPQAAQAPPVRIVVPEVPWSAAVELRELAALAVRAEPLHADGLSELRFGGSGATIAGTLPGPGYPDTVAALSDSLGGTWTMNGNTWEIAVPSTGPARPRGKPADTGPVLRSLLRHPLGLRLTAGPEKFVPPQPDGDVRLQATRRTRYRADLSGITPQDLLDAAAGMEALPVRLSGAVCAFAEWRLRDCLLHFESRTL